MNHGAKLGVIQSRRGFASTAAYGSSFRPYRLLGSGDVDVMEVPVGVHDSPQGFGRRIGDPGVLRTPCRIDLERHVDTRVRALAPEELTGLHQIVAHDCLQRQTTVLHRLNQRVRICDGLPHVRFEIQRHVVGALRIGRRQVGDTLSVMQ